MFIYWGMVGGLALLGLINFGRAVVLTTKSKSERALHLWNLTTNVALDQNYKDSL